MQDNQEEKTEVEEDIIIEKKLDDKNEVIIDKYHKGKLLGKGGFAECYEFTSENDGIIYAGKIIDKTKFKRKENKETNFQFFQKEKKNINNPKIVNVKSYFEDENNAYLVLEKCNNNSLNHLLSKRTKLTEIEATCYMFQLTQGLLFFT